MSCDAKIISEYKLLCQCNTGCLFYHRGSLYISSRPEKRAKFLLKLPARGIRKVLSGLRLTERLLRLEPRFAVPYEEGFLLSWNGGMYFVDVRAASVACLHKYRVGMNNPLGITKLQGIRGFTDGYVYGEYWGNPDAESVCIYRLENGKPVQVYSFLPGQVLHIHGITADPESGRVLICTGDSDEESVIWEASADFKQVTPLVGGSQIYRTCAAYVTKDGILYATDTPLEDNGIYLYAENHQQPKKIFSMPGPCIYSTTICSSDGAVKYVFATSVEPDSSLPAWRYRFTSRLGPGVKGRWVHIIAGDPQEGFRTMARFKKDIFPMLLFQFGNAAFPYQESEKQLYVTPVAVKGKDGSTMYIDR